MDDKKFLRMLAFLSAVLIAVLVASMHFEFQIDDDGSKHLSIDFAGRSSNRAAKSNADDLAVKNSELQKIVDDQNKRIADLQRQIDDMKSNTIEPPITDKITASSQKVDQARQLLDKNDAVAAIKLCNEAIDLNPNNATAYTFRGNGYNLLKDYTQSIIDYDKAIELDPNQTLAYLNRGLSYGNVQNYSRAIADLTKAIKLEPLSAVAYFNRGLSYSHMKNFKRAIDDFNKAIEIDPNYGAAYHGRGFANQMLNNAAQAQADFDKARALGYTPSP